MSGGMRDPAVVPVRKRRLRDRLPVRLRHHWKPAGALCAGLAMAVYFFGDARVSPYVTSSSRVEADAITQNIEGTVDLYDASVPHSMQLTYEQTDFDKMMKEFQDEGTKDYVSADLTIDGVHLEDVGIRLKGNSTLMSLRGNGKGMPGGGRNMPGNAGARQGDPPAADQGAGAGTAARTPAAVPAPPSNSPARRPRTARQAARPPPPQARTVRPGLPREGRTARVGLRPEVRRAPEVPPEVRAVRAGLPVVVRATPAGDPEGWCSTTCPRRSPRNCPG
jgi:hypothetical protein